MANIMSKKLLIISHDVVGQMMAGPGIRYWELACALAAHAHVTLVAPQPIDLVAPGVTTGSYQWGNPASLQPHLAQHDVILANGFAVATHPEVAQHPGALIIDLYDPTLLENLELYRHQPAAVRAQHAQTDVALLQRQLAVGDFFLCATERQRDLYIGAFMALGRITPEQVDRDPLLRHLIDVVPFGLPAHPSTRSGPGPRSLFPAIGHDDPLILWSGGLWDWMDPLSLIRAMPRVVAQVPNARLVFMAGSHPGLAGAMRTPQAARDLAAELGLLDQHIFFYATWVPYAERANFLLDATVVVSLHRHHLETAYAALRSRILDHLWVGLPSLLSDGDQAAQLTRQHGIGLVVPPEDEAAIADALVALLQDADLRMQCADAARSLAAHFTWPTIIQPITTFLASCSLDTMQQRSIPPMDTPQPQAPAPSEDVAQIEHERLLHATRNAAIQALEQTWNLNNLPTAAPTNRIERLLQVVRTRVLYPLLQPLMLRQQEHNAALLRSLYAIAEHNDHQRNLVERTFQIHDHRLLEVNLRAQHLLEGLQGLNTRTLQERHLLAQQLRDVADQIVVLEESILQARAHARGPLPPPPVTIPLEEDDA